jgi:hypothetical protein
MTVSRPSREIYSVDVPEVRDFAATFHYNFFVTDESVNDTGGVPDKILFRESDKIDGEYIQYATTRAPRFVAFMFTPVRLSDVGREVTDVDVRNNVFDRTDTSSNLISDNLDKIVTEDQFASFDFISVQFHDGEIDDKVFYLVSSSFQQHALEEEHDQDVSYVKAANTLSSLVPKNIKPQFLTRAMAQPKNASGAQFYSNTNEQSNSSATKARNVRNIVTKSQNQVVKADTFYKRLKSFSIHAQINGKLFHDVVGRTINDPQSPYGVDLHSLHEYSKQVTNSSKQRFSLLINDNDYKTLVPYVDLKVRRTAQYTDRRGADLVGYLIDKTEITRDGETIQHPPIVIENSRVASSADFHVKYDSTYSYSIRTIARFIVPAIDDNTGDLATIQVLVSSKPSSKVYVKTTETVPPPPPADVNFTWDYENEKLLIHWAFPPNSQRDIKKFQVFRRDNVDQPYQLLKMYDFDDSVVKVSDNETPNPSLIEYLKSPSTTFIDDDFTKQSRFIYAIADLDAHGMSSNYSAQFELSFDVFKNKLVKKLISHAGAPKPYPNLYLESDTFVDTIRVNGPHSKRMKLYFNPEFYHLYDDNEKIIRVLATKQLMGEYKLQFINIDNQKSQTLTIQIDDKIKPVYTKKPSSKQTFGKVKKTTKLR